jgi:hypothetical protein
MMPAAMNKEALKMAWLMIWNTAATAARFGSHAKQQCDQPRWLIVE